MRRWLSVIWIMALLAGCGGESGSTTPTAAATTIAATTTTTTTTTTLAPATTVPLTVSSAAPAVPVPTALVGGLPETAPGSLETAIVEDLLYHQFDERYQGPGLIDVIAPTTGGPWPTVLVFHGAGANQNWHRPDAERLAAQGRVVFLPTWMDTDQEWWDEAGVQAGWDLLAQEAVCALVFAGARATEYGGDPDHLTVYGHSAGANAALMASFADVAPLEACVEAGPAAEPQAVVQIDADWVLAPEQWDRHLSEDPESFYSFTPWRWMDGSHGFPIHVMSTEATTAGLYSRRVPDDVADSWLAYRHPDLDLAAEVTALGFLDDGYFDVQEFEEYGYRALLDAGYDATFTVIPGSTHVVWGDEGLALVVETVLHAEQG